MFRYAVKVYTYPCTYIFGHYSFTLQAIGMPNGDIDFMVETAHSFKRV